MLSYGGFKILMHSFVFKLDRNEPKNIFIAVIILAAFYNLADNSLMLLNLVFIGFCSSYKLS